MDSNQTTTEDKTASRFSMVEFMRETRREIAKVTWPERKETLVTTAMIVGMALVAGIFFLGVDSAIGYAIGHVLGMSG